MNLSLTVSSQPYTISCNDAEFAALGQQRAEQMAMLPKGEGQDDAAPVSERPGFIATEAAYLAMMIERSGAADVPAMAARILANFVGAPPASIDAEPVELTGEALKASLRAYAAAKRYAVETGGFSAVGMGMPTDRDTQAKLTAAFLLAQAVPSTSFQWKTAGGFVTINASEIGAIAVAVGQFVQSAYAAEQVVDAAIADGSITAPAQIDSADWPPN